eukprot:3898201-Rhodomonas_salina.5
MSGTGKQVMLLPGSILRVRMRCPVLTSAITLPVCFLRYCAGPSIGSAVCLCPCYAMLGADVASVGSSLLGSIWVQTELGPTG